MSKIFTYGGSFASFLGILDRIPNAEFAIAFWKLRVAYAGPCFRGRHGSNNAEGDVAFDLNNTISAFSIITITNVGSSGYSLGQTMPFSNFYSGANVFVTRMYDQSGKTNSGSFLMAAQANSSAQLRIVTSGALELINTRTAAITPSITGYTIMRISDSVQVSVSAASSVFTINVFRRPTAGTNSIMFAGNAGSYSDWWFSDNVTYAVPGGTFGGANSGTGNFISVYQRNAANHIQIYRNNTQIGTTVTSATAIAYNAIHNRAGDFSTAMSWALSIMWAQDLSGSRVTIQNLVNGYYGI